MDTSLPSTESRGAPRDANAERPVLVGTLLWALALLILLLIGDRLPVDDAGRWQAVAAAGTALGVVGVAITRRRARRSRASGTQQPDR
jgi:hypothetical protein